MDLLQTIYDFVWGIPSLMLILGTGIYLSIRTRFCQIRLLPSAMKMFFSRFSSRDGTSSFRALCTALAATVGTGNLAGVAGAIAIGGPGAVFWMWVCGLLGMAIKFAEATLAIRFRARNRAGEFVGGPMYMIANALPKSYGWLAGTYAFFGVIAAFGVGNATQIHTVLSALQSGLQNAGVAMVLPIRIFAGGILALLVGLMLLGGAKRIGAVAEMLVPIAAGLYLILGLTVLILRLDVVPAAFMSILQGACSPRSVTGGVVGSVMITLRTGISRGVFTNEAGMGTASIAHAGATVTHPVLQGMMGIVEVFLDTIVICTVTALVILCSGVPIAYGVDPGVTLTADAFSNVLGSWVYGVLTVCLCLFALATVLGWGLYGIRCAQYLLGDSAWRPFVYLQILIVFLSALLRTTQVWRLAEIVNGLMAIPNLIAILALSPELINLYKSYMNGGHYENLHQCQSL